MLSIQRGRKCPYVVGLLDLRAIPAHLNPPPDAGSSL